MIAPRFRNIGQHTLSSFEKQRTSYNDAIKAAASSHYNLFYVNIQGVEENFDALSDDKIHMNSIEGKFKYSNTVRRTLKFGASQLKAMDF